MLFDAVVLMSDLARPNLAYLYLQKLMQANPNDATLLKLRDKHGPAMFLKLSNDIRAFIRANDSSLKTKS